MKPVKEKIRAQVKSKWYYIFWGTATVSVVLGQLYVGTGYRLLYSGMQELLDERKISLSSISYYLIINF